jgi:ribosomal-protein-alanine N-acetyltransferase
MIFRSEPAHVRPAVEEDRNGLRRLLQRALRVHVHVDWRSADDYLGQAPYLVADTGKQLVACLACPPDPPPAAWIRLASLSDGRSSGDFAALLAPGLAALAALTVQELVVLQPERWLHGALRDAGFQPLVDVVTYLREAAPIPDEGARQIEIRPAEPDDLARVVALDAAAFEPRWRHSAAMLRAAYDQVTSFEVAWLDGSPVGYQFSSTYGRYGHIARMAVHPNHQGQRIGARLLVSALTRLRERGANAVTLNTQVDNIVSRRLYERFGFRLTGERATAWRLEIGD